MFNSSTFPMIINIISFCRTYLLNQSAEFNISKRIFIYVFENNIFNWRKSAKEFEKSEHKFKFLSSGILSYDLGI